MAPCDADTSRRPLGIAMGRGDQPCAPAFFPRGLILLVGDLVVVDVVVALLLPLLVLLLLLAFAVSHSHTVSHVRHGAPVTLRAMQPMPPAEVHRFLA